MDEKKDDISRMIREHCSTRSEEFTPGKTQVPLMKPSFGYEEVNEAMDSLLSSFVTMGKKVKIFEQMFSKYIGVKGATMVNSGSSANLVALSVLSSKLLKGGLRPGDEVITPAVTWATTVYPIENVNCTSVLVDVNADDFNINIDALKRAITTKTKAIMPVHLLGNPCDIKQIMEIANEKDLFVLEDSCEAHGAEAGGKKAGSFGDIGTFSFFISHHITTIEGGMVVTDNEEYHEMAKGMRAFGWIRDQKNGDAIAKRYGGIDRRFLFTNVGFNFRPTEMQGGFGIRQLPKLEKFIDIRRENANYWGKRFEEYSDFIGIQNERAGTRHVWYAYPITVMEGAPFTREEMVKHLEKNNIETRPIMAGNMNEQPVIKLINHRIAGSLKNSEFIMRNSFFFGNHQGVGKKEREFVADCIADFIDTKTRHE